MKNLLGSKNHPGKGSPAYNHKTYRLRLRPVDLVPICNGGIAPLLNGSNISCLTLASTIKSPLEARNTYSPERCTSRETLFSRQDCREENGAFFHIDAFTLSFAWKKRWERGLMQTL
jgi:hypothetical protein